MNGGRDRVALVLAVAASGSVLILTAAAMVDVLADPTQSIVSGEYVALITGTLGVIVGGLVGYLGGKRDQPQQTKDAMLNDNADTQEET